MRNTALLMLLMTLVACSSVGQLNAQEEEGGAEFLENVISQLRQDNYEGRPASDIFMPTPNPPAGIPPPPPLGLSQQELSSLYQHAGTATGPGIGTGIGTGTGPMQIHTDEHPGQLGHLGHPSQSGQPQGYYYYWYPLKTGMGAGAGTGPMAATAAAAVDHRVEPLFMAVSGFIGIALVFVASVLFMPRLTKMGVGLGTGPPHAHGAGAAMAGAGMAGAGMAGAAAWKPRPTDLNTLTKLVAQAIGGKDCSARIACELAYALRGAQANKPLRVLEIILPQGVGNQIQLIRQSATKRMNTCNMPCKLRPNNAQALKQRQIQNQKKKRLQLQTSFVHMKQ